MRFCPCMLAACRAGGGAEEGVVSNDMRSMPAPVLSFPRSADGIAAGAAAAAAGSWVSSRSATAPWAAGAGGGVGWAAGTTSKMSAAASAWARGGPGGWVGGTMSKMSAAAAWAGGGAAPKISAAATRAGGAASSTRRSASAFWAGGAASKISVRSWAAAGGAGLASERSTRSSCSNSMRFSSIAGLCGATPVSGSGTSSSSFSDSSAAFAVPASGAPSRAWAPRLASGSSSQRLMSTSAISSSSLSGAWHVTTLTNASISLLRPLAIVVTSSAAVSSADVTESQKETSRSCGWHLSHRYQLQSRQSMTRSPLPTACLHPSQLPAPADFHGSSMWPLGHCQHFCVVPSLPKPWTLIGIAPELPGRQRRSSRVS
mmetsp:Transcript_40249/g.113815  ORF Transcript_40249/g.113815 Transcript_40249/m.113815 type:complete len:373 (+) Transcript_40249:262-1380(+)